MFHVQGYLAESMKYMLSKERLLYILSRTHLTSELVASPERKMKSTKNTTSHPNKNKSELCLEINATHARGHYER